jgi:hypothetical protein
VNWEPGINLSELAGSFKPCGGKMLDLEIYLLVEKPVFKRDFNSAMSRMTDVVYASEPKLNSPRPT